MALSAYGRDAEVDAIERLVAAGEAALIVLKGPGGIGKSRLLSVAAERARTNHLRVLEARGGVLESGLSFGVVRQLFELTLARATPDERAAWLQGTAARASVVLEYGDDRIDERFAVLHALYWLCANMTRDRSLLLAIDDAQWIDEPSAAFLEFLARRLEGLPLIVAIATRPIEPSSPAGLAALARQPDAHALNVQPLDRAAVAAWLRSALGEQVDDEFVAACHRVTVGNALLVRELIAEIRAQGMTGTAAEATAVEALGPREVAAMIAGRLSAAATPLAHAAAVLGDGASLRDAQALAGLSDRDAALAEVALADAELIVRGADPMRFIHPIVHAAILAGIPAARRDALHRAAALHLHARGASPQQVSSHLLLTRPAAEPWVVDLLADAARRAVAVGDPGGATRYLSRALSEPPPEAERAAVLLALGSAQADAGSEAAIGTLREAIRLADDPQLRVDAAVELAQLLKFWTHQDASVEVLREAQRSVDPELANRLQAELLAIALSSASGYRNLRAELEHLDPVPDAARTRLEAVTLTAHAWLDLCAGRPAEGVVALAERAVGWARPATFDPVGFLLPACCLAFAGRLDRAEELLAQGRAAARRQGSPVAIASLAAMSGFCAYRRGALLEGENHLETAQQLVSLVPFYAPVIGAYAALIGYEREAPPVTLADPDLEHSDFDALQLFLARGRQRQSKGALEEALRDYLACDRAEVVWGSGNPAVIPWRSAAASVLKALGDNEQAGDLVDDERRRARAFGEPAALGRALHAGARDVEDLRAAVEQLEQGQMRLVHADALVDLGSALRAAGERGAARERLREGLRLAMSCGATRVIRRARAELGAAGGRVRADGTGRVDTLTASERRVAQLAAQGCANREIAEQLFVTEKTVETHLAKTFRKLNIRSRRALPQLLGTP